MVVFRSSAKVVPFRLGETIEFVRFREKSRKSVLPSLQSTVSEQLTWT